MPTQTIATVRRRLGFRLRAKREGAVLSIDAAAHRLGWPPERVKRVEQGVETPSPAEVRALVALYRADDAEREEWLAHVHEADRSGWQRYGGLLSQDYIDYLTLEETAAVMRQYHPCLVPGLLQTENYARAVYAQVRDDGEETVGRLVQARLERQLLLESQGRPELHVVIDEAALRRRTGSAQDMIDQVLRLQELNGRPGIDIRLLPLSFGPHPGLIGSFNLLEFDLPGDDWVLFFESGGGDDIRRDYWGNETARYLDVFDRLEAACLDPAATDDFYRGLISRLRSEP